MGEWLAGEFYASPPPAGSILMLGMDYEILEWNCLLTEVILQYGVSNLTLSQFQEMNDTERCLAVISTGTILYQSNKQEGSGLHGLRGGNVWGTYVWALRFVDLNGNVTVAGSFTIRITITLVEMQKY